MTIEDDYKKELEKEIERITSLPEEEQKEEIIKKFKMLEEEKLEYQKLASEILKYEKCDQCGKCCKEAPVELSEEEIIKISKYLRINEIDFIKRYTQKHSQKSTYLKSPCPFLVENRKENKTTCKIYFVRPEVCKFFPFSADPFPPSIQWIDFCHIASKINEKIDKFFPNDTSRSLSENELFIKSVIEKEARMKAEIFNEKSEGIKGKGMGVMCRCRATTIYLLEILSEKLKYLK